MQLYPFYPEYRLYWAQSLYNAFMFPEAAAIASQVNHFQEEKIFSLIRFNTFIEIEILILKI